MNRRLFVLLTVPLPMLTSCGGLVGKLIPPVIQTAPAGLSGATMLASGDLQSESVGGSIVYDTSRANPPASFPDFSFDGLPLNIRPHSVTFNGSFASAALSGPCALPASIKLTVKSMTIKVSDAAGTASLTQTPGLVLTLTKSGENGNYGVSSNSLVLSDDTATNDTLIRVLSSGGSNDASLSATISVQQDSLAGCRLSFTLGNATTTLSDFS